MQEPPVGRLFLFAGWKWFQRCLQEGRRVCYDNNMHPIYYIEYLLVAALWWLYRLMPVRWAYGVGWGIGVGFFSLFRWQRRARMAIDNVLIAGLAKTRREAYLIARNSVGHFAGHVCEALRISDLVTHKNWEKYVTLEMSQETRDLLMKPTGPVILATGHLGAWEAGITAITSARPLFAVARLMDNPYIQKFLERHNFRGGTTIIPKKHGFTSSAMHRWKDQQAALVILFDQHCSNGAQVPFFGHTVGVYTSPARIHLRSHAPILVGGFLRTGPLKYEMVAVGDPIYYKEGVTLEALTAELIARLEKVIARAPEQYLWLHRRFRNIPVPQVPAR